jgi:hypothetical protein
MRVLARLTAILIGLSLSHLALADAQQPQRWVSADGASRLLGVDTTTHHPESIYPAHTSLDTKVSPAQ